MCFKRDIYYRQKTDTQRVFLSIFKYLRRAKLSLENVIHVTLPPPGPHTKCQVRSARCQVPNPEHRWSSHPHTIRTYRPFWLVFPCSVRNIFSLPAPVPQLFPPLRDRPGTRTKVRPRARPFPSFGVTSIAEPRLRRDPISHIDIHHLNFFPFLTNISVLSLHHDPLRRH